MQGLRGIYSCGNELDRMPAATVMKPCPNGNQALTNGTSHAHMKIAWGEVGQVDDGVVVLTWLVAGSARCPRWHRWW